MSPSEAQLSRLMAMAQDGDREAYRVVLDSCRLWLLRYFARRIGPAAVDDLVQDTLMSLHRKRATYDPARPFLPWLAAIARYRWVDQLRRTYRADETMLEDNLSVGSGEDSTVARLSVDRLLDRLPPGQAAAIRLVKIEGLSVIEASARCGQSESLVKVNVHRGLKRLAGWIESA